MSSFFTLPASQRKRKRDNERTTKPSRPSTNNERVTKQRRKDRDESISGSDSEGPEDGVDDTSHTIEEDSSSSEDEDAAARRTKLAARYLENTRKEILAEGFDAKDIDDELLAERMGERLKEDTAESKGKVYRWIADDYILNGCRHGRFSNGSGVLTGVAVCHPFVYTVSKDARLSKWEIRGSNASDGEHMDWSTKPKLVGSVKGDRSRKRDNKYNGHTAEIYCVAASSDGKFVATGGKDRKLVVWDAVTLKPLRSFAHHRDAVMSLCFRRGTNQLFTVSRDRTVKIWSLNELAYIETLYGHQDEILDVASLNQENCVTAGARDKTARFWKVVEESQLVFRGGGGHNSLAKRRKHDNPTENNSEAPLPSKSFHEGSTDRVAMIDEDTFVTGSDNGGISLWNINKKKAIYTYPTAHGIEEPKSLDEVSAEMHPNDSAIPESQPRGITALATIPYSNIFFSGSWDGYVRAWKLSEDRRQIEPLGAVEIQHRGIPGDVLYNSINGIYDDEAIAKGCINDIALLELGNKGKDGIGLIVVTGKEHRLGTWQAVQGRNTGVIFQIPKKDD